MRKLIILILTLTLALAVGCGKSGNQERNGDPPGKSSAERPQGDRKPAADPGRNPGAKPGSDIDIDSLNIPEQMKEAIKSGKISGERAQEIIAQARGAAGEAMPVSVGTVKRQDLNSYLVLNGVVEPERTVEIFSRLSAYVKDIIKEEGDYVKENDVLALLDDTEIKISYEQAKIQLEQAKLSLDEAEANYLRNQELMKRELISEQEFQTQEAACKQRQLDYQNRQESYKDLELQLNYTKIRSLSEGFITERLIEEGDRVNTNQQVYTIEDFKPLLIRVYVPTSDAINLRGGMPAEVTTEVLKGTTFNGGVTLINPRIDVQTGTVKVTVEVVDNSLRLKPGMFVEVRIAVGAKENVLAIPRQAVLYKQNKTYVFLLEGSQVSQREVLLGLTEEDNVEVTEGLNEGDVIVTLGVEALKDGQRVDVVQ
jgi:RND family efflux transporter MFP subunit